MISVVLELGLGVLAVVLGAFFGTDPREWVPALTDVTALGGGALYGLLGAVPLVIAVRLLEKLPFRMIRELQQATEERLLKLMIHFRTRDLATISLCAGVGEEMLFRGWLLMSLVGPLDVVDLGTLTWAIAVSSLLFGFAHPISPLYIGVTGLMGAYFAGLLLWSENLLVPIVAHAAYDFVELVWALRDLRRRGE